MSTDSVIKNRPAYSLVYWADYPTGGINPNAWENFSATWDATSATWDSLT
jgi:hypothetical protein